MKTKHSRLAPIVVEILMARGSGHKILTESGTTREVSKRSATPKKINTNGHEFEVKW